MIKDELIEKSIYIVTEYYKNNLEPFFNYLSEDVLWIGPAYGQRILGREEMISAFSSEKHELTFTMGEIQVDCVSPNKFVYEIVLKYEIYTHYPDGNTDLHHQRLHYSWVQKDVKTENDTGSRWEIALLHTSNAWQYDRRDTIYPVHYEMVNQYVYDSCDYFILLDAKNNRYNMIHGQAGTILLPETSNDYEQEMIEYTNTFVSEENRKTVIQEMRLARVIEQIEKNGSHFFTYGIMDTKRGYTRKRLDYRYHDRDEKIILMSRTDITEQYLEEEKLKQELENARISAQTDSLTKLLNVQTMKDKVEESLKQEEDMYALCFIDLDDFKSINDNYGHQAGDSVLRNIANALRTIQGKDDIIGRVGGDEFVYFAKITDENHAVEIAQRICYVIHSVKITNHAKRRVTGSVGVALAPKDGSDYDTLVHLADHGLYEAKKCGKNQYVIA